MIDLIRNSIKYVPSKDYKQYTVQLKKVYGAPGLKAAEAELEKFKQTWSQYPGAIDVWVRNWEHVAQLSNWALVRNQLSTDDAIQGRIENYENQ